MPPVDAHDRLGRGPRVVVVGLGVALVVHSALVALWLAPSSPLRDAVGDQRLASYVDPYFQQGDDTAGIGANRVDESLQVSAFVRTSLDAEPTTTRWYDVTEVDARAIRGDLGPARSRTASRRIAVLVNAVMFELTGSQRAVVADIAADDPPTQVLQDLTAAGKDPNVVSRFASADEMARRYASLWLGARLTDVEILQVRYRVGRRDAPDADERDASTSARSFSWFDLGWRRPFRGTPEARAAFDESVGAARG